MGNYLLIKYLLYIMAITINIYLITSTMLAILTTIASIIIFFSIINEANLNNANIGFNSNNIVK